MRLPNKKYGVILMDPPWSYRDKANAGKRGASHKYGTMGLDEIKALPVPDLAANNCALFMWVTNPFLREAFELFDAWGFTYKTKAFEWVKLNKKSETLFMGMGNWTRQNDEQCLLAIKGKPKRVDAGVHSVILSKRREHSRKPDEQYERIERLLGGPEIAGPHLEMFARQTRPGWDSWGMEVGKFDGTA